MSSISTSSNTESQSDRIQVQCDIKIDHLVQARKNTRASKETKLILSRDGIFIQRVRELTFE
jgi:hypothetical protein